MREPTALTLPIRDVVVLEDRAHVTRRGEVEVPAGAGRLIVRGVAPVIVDKSIGVRLSDERVSALHARVVRTPVFERTEEIDDEVRRMRARLEQIESRQRRQSRDAYDTDRILVALLDESAEDAAWGRPLNVERQRSYEELVRRSRALAETLARVHVEIEELRRALDRKLARRRAEERPDLGMRADLEIEVEAREAAACEVTVTYVVANACWRPRHRAVLDDDKRVVRLETEGVVWQNTGEDWADTSLALSTERASLGTEIPKLETDKVHTRKKGALVVETRQEKIERAGLGAQPGAGRVETIEEMPGIEDGGEAQHLRSPDAVTVPSDGRPHAIPLSTLESEAELELVIAAELVVAAVTRTTFANVAARPLLAGPVDLVRRGGASGRTTVGFIAPGERVAIGWGPEPAIAVHREVEPLKDETSLLGSWTTQAHDVRVTVANLGDRPRTVVVQERVPVSEIDKVKIDVVQKETTDGKDADAAGILTWKLELSPRAQKTIKLRVSTKRHADVIG
jgi:uncharacterized protein (TIGR02231 family)